MPVRISAGMQATGHGSGSVARENPPTTAIAVRTSSSGEESHITPWFIGARTPRCQCLCGLVHLLQAFRDVPAQPGGDRAVQAGHGGAEGDLVVQVRPAAAV